MSGNDNFYASKYGLQREIGKRTYELTRAIGKLKEDRCTGCALIKDYARCYAAESDCEHARGIWVEVSNG